jgi:hypothetical protein
MKKFHAILTIMALIILAGCGGGDNNSTPTPTSEASVSGVVADGYLVNATVFSDRNGDMIWTEGEPKTTTGAGGQYTLTGVDVDKNRINVMVEAGVTVDEDNGIPVAKSYVLMAPVGKSDFISPLTTMVQGLIEKGKTFSEAEAFIKGELGMPSVDLFANYMADSTTADAELHAIAQVLAVSFGNLQEAGQSVSTQENLVSHIVDIVTGELSAIGTDPVNYDPEVLVNFSTDTFAGKTFIIGEGIGENQFVSIFTFNQDGTYSEWANDYNSSPLTETTGNWLISNGHLVIGTADGSLQLNTANYIDLLIAAESGVSSERFYKSTSFTSELLSGKTFSYQGNGFGTMTFNSNGSGTNGTEPFTWSVVGGVLKIGTGNFFLYAGGTTDNFKIAGYDFTDVYIGTIALNLQP